jgi:hypothetical protein
MSRVRPTSIYRSTSNVAEHVAGEGGGTTKLAERSDQSVVAQLADQRIARHKNNANH